MGDFQARLVQMLRERTGESPRPGVGGVPATTRRGQAVQEFDRLMGVGGAPPDPMKDPNATEGEATEMPTMYLQRSGSPLSDMLNRAMAGQGMGDIGGAEPPPPQAPPQEESWLNFKKPKPETPEETEARIRAEWAAGSR